jgi:hypothetical protein
MLLLFIFISSAVSVSIYSVERQNIRKEEMRRIWEVRAIKVNNYLKTPSKTMNNLSPYNLSHSTSHIDPDAGDKADPRKVGFCPA